MKSEILRQELKHKKQWDELRAINTTNEKELEHLQVCQNQLRHVFEWKFISPLPRITRRDHTSGAVVLLSVILVVPAAKLLCSKHLIIICWCEHQLQTEGNKLIDSYRFIIG